MKATRQKSRPSFADHVYNTLYGRISNGDYPPDEKLPSETTLAAEIGVSRPVLRDALERLRAEGLIVSRQGAGNFVRAHQSRTLGYGRIETIADIQRCYEFRLTIEPQAARFAAERRNDEALANLSNALDLMRAATGSMLHREDADFTFHIAVAHAANNTFFEATLRALHEQISAGMKMHGQSLLREGGAGLERVLHEHQSIFDAILASDGEAAANRMTAHVRHSQERLFGGASIDLRMPAKK
ncbi:FadR/GntR family transcriptional regulator [Rhodovulum sulfidophilum]|uniref:FadR family transcriptional regulator n=1 Tax=Rhodovulum sulfidophilum TaxID=35806 RepID=A0ABS1RRX6_RHOSU|nr:FadR/GntR family transcriptional regulator [Rhodovulum sulfidophilum]MBL3608821.1 FadR family transcriptional regulator [Rhodovulum sulfidophilum]MCE8455825.1 FadR family transcriptional regulator [Rhodovulum sulfidophilum]